MFKDSTKRAINTPKMSAVPIPETTRLEFTIIRCLADHSKLVVLVSSFWVVCVFMMYYDNK